MRHQKNTVNCSQNILASQNTGLVFTAYLFNLKLLFLLLLLLLLLTILYGYILSNRNVVQAYSVILQQSPEGYWRT